MDLSKEYLGRVEYVDDPTFSGRCKIRVFGIFDNLETENIPWFSPQSSLLFSSKAGFGSLSVPKVGSIVRVKFSNQDIYSGEYTNIQNIDPALIDEIKDDYQNTHVLMYDSEQDVLIIYQTMTGIKLWMKGSMIKIDADGSIQLKHMNNSNIIELNDNKINIVTTGESERGSNLNGIINIASGATVNVVAPTVNIDANSIALGKDANDKAVKGAQLVKVLQQIVTELNTKFPQGASTLVGKDFSEILSNVVTLK